MKLRITSLILLSLALIGPPALRAQETKPSSVGEALSKRGQKPRVKKASEKAPLGTILKISFKGLHAMDETVVAEVAELKVGQEFTKERLENSINSLEKWGVFSKVEVIVEYSNEGVELHYDLQEGFIIKDVVIKGNYPLLETTVRRVLFLNPGQVYDSSKLPEQVDRLDKLYEKEGYFDTSVFSVEDYNEAKHEVTLRFKIQKGKTFRTRYVNVEGNSALKLRKIRSIIYTINHYKPRTLKKNLEKVQNLYKNDGYVRARVKLYGENYDYDDRKVDLDISIRQGKRVFVAFEGNDHMSVGKLKKQITIYEDGDFDDYELDASKRNLTNYYKQNGYEDVIVDPAKEKLDEQNYFVTFKIHEGQDRKVRSITFKGNEHYGAGKLRSLMLSKEMSLSDRGYYLQPLFEQDLKLLEDYYKREGFLDAEVESWDKNYNGFGDRVYLNVNIKENPQAIVHELHVEGLNEAQKKDVLPDLLDKPGEAYSPSRLEEDINLILVRLSNVGYPYATIEHHETKVKENLWDVNLKVNSGPVVRIGRLLFVGNSLTQEKVLRKNLRIKEGALFSTKNILQSQLNLRQLGIFDTVNVETLGLANKEEVVQTLVRVQEKKSKIIDLEAGYNTDHGFNGKVVFNKLNMWGSGKNGNIKLQGGQEVSRFEINYIDPRFRGTGLQLLIGGFAGFERRPFFQNFSAGAFSTIFKNITPVLSTYGRLKFEYVNDKDQTTVLDQLRPASAIQDRTRVVSTLGVTYDKRDNFGNPHNGYYLNGNVSLTNQFIQQGGNYVTGKASLGHWYSPFPRVVFANALRVAKIFPLPSSTNVPVDDRLYLGGDDTVRGFDQDSLLPTGGLFSLVHNFEIQVEVMKNIQVVGFLDSGVVVNSMDQINLSTLRHSAGPGIRYLTPVGPIRVEYGFKLDRQEGESLGRLHFSFGYFF